MQIPDQQRSHDLLLTENPLNSQDLHCHQKMKTVGLHWRCHDEAVLLSYLERNKKVSMPERKSEVDMRGELLKNF